MAIEHTNISIKTVSNDSNPSDVSVVVNSQPSSNMQTQAQNSFCYNEAPTAAPLQQRHLFSTNTSQAAANPIQHDPMAQQGYFQAISELLEGIKQMMIQFMSLLGGSSTTGQAPGTRSGGGGQSPMTTSQQGMPNSPATTGNSRSTKANSPQTSAAQPAVAKPVIDTPQWGPNDSWTVANGGDSKALTFQNGQLYIGEDFGGDDGIFYGKTGHKNDLDERANMTGILQNAWDLTPNEAEEVLLTLQSEQERDGTGISAGYKNREENPEMQLYNKIDTHAKLQDIFNSLPPGSDANDIKARIKSVYRDEDSVLGANEASSQVKTQWGPQDNFVVDNGGAKHAIAFNQGQITFGDEFGGKDGVFTTKIGVEDGQNDRANMIMLLQTAYSMDVDQAKQVLDHLLVTQKKTGLDGSVDDGEEGLRYIRTTNIGNLEEIFNTMPPNANVEAFSKKIDEVYRA